MPNIVITLVYACCFPRLALSRAAATLSGSRSLLLRLLPNYSASPPLNNSRYTLIVNSISQVVICSSDMCQIGAPPIFTSHQIIGFLAIIRHGQSKKRNFIVAHLFQCGD
ncbi:hypothetical protein Droror1_Dr00012748 [Drosera rotundifolia]